ncbi:hypothetical protein RUM44_006477 [Polyplax serrata]|uniref:Uncharacterized protein n=1 Tax=Polyplax serrata TaxID=468196 RepID=A0ABR1AIE7_POLSC
MTVEEIVVEPDSGVSIEPDSGVSFELHDLQFGSGVSVSAHGDDKKGSKVIVVAEMSERDPEQFCDKSISRKKSDVKKLLSENELWKKSIGFQGIRSNSSRNKSKSSQDLVSDEDVEDEDVDFGETCVKDNECFAFEEAALSEESLVEHFEHLFEAKPYHGVREWL